MWKTLLLASLCISIFNIGFSKPVNPPFKGNLSGRITDKISGEGLSGVSIYLPDLKTGTISNDDGTYQLNNLPESKVVIQLSLLGYKLVVETIDLSSITTKDFVMEEAVAELHEIVVTGTAQGSEKNRTATPITTVPRLQLLQVSSSNIIDALSKQPGISQISSGVGISKPVIRGLGYNRVVVLNDGIRQEGQQWGDEHGIEIDEFSVNHVEILKGPASLSYGSDAIAGVINMLSAPTLPEGSIHGNILTNYQTNNGLVGISGNISGNRKGIIWDVRYSNKSAHAYQNHYDGYVLNSGFKESNLSGIIGINKSWGYSHLHFGAYTLTPGIVEGDRDSISGKFLKPVILNDETAGSTIANNKDYKSYTPNIPFQKVNHFKAVLNNSFVMGNGSLKATLGFQQNQRKEFGNILTPAQYQLYFLLNTLNYDVRYLIPDLGGINLSVGINGMHQSSQNKGTEYLIPEYKLFDIGAFAILKKNYGKLDIQGGLRYDTRSETSDDLFLDQEGNKTNQDDPNATKKFSYFKSNFSGISGSLGATYQFNEVTYIKLNVSKGYRAPNISELGSNGVHEGTIRYEVGNIGLKAESSLEGDLAFGINTHHVTAEIDVFSNNIDNFIFSQKLKNHMGLDSLIDKYPVYKFTAGNARLLGGEIMIDIHPHPLDWLHFQNSFSFVNATLENQPDSTKYLPFTPPAKFSSELRANIKKLNRFMGNFYFSVGLDYYFAQNQFYAANGTETASPAYSLINLGLGTDIISKDKTICSLYINVNNLTDNSYQSHLSRLKYTALNNATGRRGIFNMGQNVSVKLIIPIELSKK